MSGWKSLNDERSGVAITREQYMRAREKEAEKEEETVVVVELSGNPSGMRIA